MQERATPKTPGRVGRCHCLRRSPIRLPRTSRRSRLAQTGRCLRRGSGVGVVYWQDAYATRLFRAAVKRVGLPSGTTTHDLRHHYASVLLAAGESVMAVGERLGHENATLVLKSYGHLMRDSEDRTRLAVDDAWCATTVPLEQSAARSPAQRGGG